MDPLSIAVAVLAASEAVGSVSQALYTFITSAKSVDDSVKNLHDEVQSLAAILDAIDLALKQPIVTETREYTSLASGVWTSVNHAINDSQHTVNALGAILQGLGDADKASSSFRRVIKQVKLKFKASDISSVKDRIHTHTTSLQLALQMISVFLGCVCSENALNVINPKLDDIGPKVENLVAMVARLNASQIKPIEAQLPDTFRNPELSVHTEELARSIKAVVTAASSAGGLKSSKWAGSETNFLYFSEYGKLLDDTWRTRMEQWIPPPTLKERPAISKGFSASAEMTDTASRAEDELFENYESDDELDLNIVQTLIKTGGKDYAQQRYAEAAKYYRASIDRAKHLSQAKTSSLELEKVTSRLAAAEAEIESGLVQRIFEEAQQAFARADYCEAADMFRNGISRTRKLSLDKRSRFDLKGIQQKIAINLLHLGDLNEAERAFKGIAGQDIINDESRAYKLHASSGLALVHLCRRDFVASERWCRQSLVGWGRLLGKEHSLYNRSLQLLALIQEIKGDFATASALDILSKNPKSDFDKESDARIGNLVTSGIDTASFRVLVSNYYLKCANDLLHVLGMDLQAEEFEKDVALLKLTAVQSDSGLRSEFNITFTVRHLLDQGADANARDSEGDDTALMKASSHGHRDIVQLLYERGADVNAKNTNGNTALHFAVRGQAIAVVELLLKLGANMEATERKCKETALMLAAGYGQNSIALILLQAGASVSATNYRGATALAVAVRNGYEVMVKILLDSGADLESRDEDGSTPLIVAVVAASWDEAEMVRVLLAAGAKIDACNFSGGTPLIKAAERGKRAVMKVLLDAGASIDAQNDDGNTSLSMLLLSQGHWEGCYCSFCLKLLLRSDLLEMLVWRGANLSLKNTLGQSAIDFTKEYQGHDRAHIIAVLNEALAIDGKSQKLDCKPEQDAKTAKARRRRSPELATRLPYLPDIEEPHP